MPSLTVLLICDNGTGLWRHNRHLPVYLFKHVLQRRRLLRLLIAYTDFVEGLQKYFESCNTAVTKRKLSLLFFDSTEHCHGYDDDYVSEHASNKLQMFASRVTNSSIINIIHVQKSQAHAHECFDFIIYNDEHQTDAGRHACMEEQDRNTEFGIKFCISLFLRACRPRPTSINLVRSNHRVVICTLVTLANAKF